MKTFAMICCAFLMFTFAAGQGYQPKAGFVPDSATAVKIAEAVLIPVYGAQQVSSERPFNAVLKDGVWAVTGTLRCPGARITCKGGTARVRISKLDGRILYLNHGQ